MDELLVIRQGPNEGVVVEEGQLFLPGRGPVDYTSQIGKPIRKVLGLPGGFFDTQAEPVMADAMARLVERLRGRGWQIDKVPLPPPAVLLGH